VESATKSFVTLLCNMLKATDLKKSVDSTTNQEVLRSTRTTVRSQNVDRITSQLIRSLSPEPRSTPPPPVCLGVMYDLRAMKKHWEEKLANTMNLSAERRQIETRKLYDEGSSLRHIWEQWKNMSPAVEKAVVMQQIKRNAAVQSLVRSRSTHRPHEKPQTPSAEEEEILISNIAQLQVAYTDVKNLFLKNDCHYLYQEGRILALVDKFGKIVDYNHHIYPYYKIHLFADEIFESWYKTDLLFKKVMKINSYLKQLAAKYQHVKHLYHIPTKDEYNDSSPPKVKNAMSFESSVPKTSSLEDRTSHHPVSSSVIALSGTSSNGITESNNQSDCSCGTSPSLSPVISPQSSSSPISSSPSSLSFSSSSLESLGTNNDINMSSNLSSSSHVSFAVTNNSSTLSLNVSSQATAPTLSTTTLPTTPLMSQKTPTTSTTLSPLPSRSERDRTRESLENSTVSKTDCIVVAQTSDRHQQSSTKLQPSPDGEPILIEFVINITQKGDLSYCMCADYRDMGMPPSATQERILLGTLNRLNQRTELCEPSETMNSSECPNLSNDSHNVVISNGDSKPLPSSSLFQRLPYNTPKNSLKRYRITPIIMSPNVLKLLAFNMYEHNISLKRFKKQVKFYITHITEWLAQLHEEAQSPLNMGLRTLLMGELNEWK
jgi:hypothetical protein